MEAKNKDFFPLLPPLSRNILCHFPLPFYHVIILLSEFFVFFLSGVADTFWDDGKIPSTLFLF